MIKRPAGNNKRRTKRGVKPEKTAPAVNKWKIAAFVFEGKGKENAKYCNKIKKPFIRFNNMANNKDEKRKKKLKMEI
jgi:hypothetical protein